MRASALSRLATRAATVLGLARPTELVPFDVVVTGVPRRSSREWAQSEQHARQLAAERFRVPVERVVIPQSCYSLTAGNR